VASLALRFGERRPIAAVIIPAFNEVERIAETVECVRSALATLPEVDSRILVVDDGSTDGTVDAASAAGANRVIRHQQNAGLGAAVRTGLMAARSMGADLVVKFDADLQHEPLDIVAMLRPLLNDEADLVFGNRFSGLTYPMPIIRRLGNRVFTWLMRRLTRWSVKDSQPGIFAASAEYLAGFRIPGDYNYTQQVLLDGYHRGLRFVHVPVSFRARTTGRSFVSFRYPFKVLRQILVMLVVLNPIRVFVPVGLVFIGVATIIVGLDLSAYLQGVSTQLVARRFAVLGFGLFGLQTVFFGLLGHLIIYHRGR
jgi:glycosyltransferase involved in cell wall biosynthesis